MLNSLSLEAVESVSQLLATDQQARLQTEHMIKSF